MMSPVKCKRYELKDPLWVLVRYIFLFNVKCVKEFESKRNAKCLKTPNRLIRMNMNVVFILFLAVVGWCMYVKVKVERRKF